MRNTKILTPNSVIVIDIIEYVTYGFNSMLHFDTNSNNTFIECEAISNRADLLRLTESMQGRTEVSLHVLSQNSKY